MEARNLLLHAAWISNNDVPSAACLPWLGLKRDFFGGSWHFIECAAEFVPQLAPGRHQRMKKKGGHRTAPGLTYNLHTIKSSTA
jgi:hypothetical protein